MAHQPDNQLALRLHARIHRCVFDIGRLAALFKDEIKLRVRLGARVEHAGPRGEFIALRLRIVERERHLGGVRNRRQQLDDEEAEK